MIKTRFFHSKQWLAAIFILLVIFTQNASAADTAYTDVPEDHPYYEAIMYYTEAGVVSGVGDNRFEPDRDITANEYSVILMRVFHPDVSCETVSGQNWAENYITNAYISHAFSVEAYMSLLEQLPITREFAWTNLAEVAGIQYYPAWFYTGEEPGIQNDKKDLVYMMESSGLISESFIGSEEASASPSRGELLNFLYRIQTGDYTSPEAPELPCCMEWGENDLTVWRMRNELLYRLSKLPSAHLEKFNENGWKLILTHDIPAYYPNYTNINKAVGMCDYSKRALVLASADSIYHEFGHYSMANASNYNLALNDMWTYELDNIVFLTRSYAGTNRSEMFAEAYAYVLTHRDNPDAYAVMEDLIPITLRYIEDGWLTDNGLPDTAMISQIHRELSAQKSA